MLKLRILNHKIKTSLAHNYNYRALANEQLDKPFKRTKNFTDRLISKVILLSHVPKLFYCYKIPIKRPANDSEN